MDTKISILATKEDVARAETKIEASKAEVLKDVGNSKAEVIRWMFVFWAGQMVAIFSLIVLFLKK